MLLTFSCPVFCGRLKVIARGKQNCFCVIIQTFFMFKNWMILAFCTSWEESRCMEHFKWVKYELFDSSCFKIQFNLRQGQKAAVMETVLHTKDEVVRSKDLPKRSGPHRVHCSRLQIDKDCTGHVLVSYRKNRSQLIDIIVTLLNSCQY